MYFKVQKRAYRDEQFQRHDVLHAVTILLITFPLIIIYACLVEWYFINLTFCALLVLLCLYRLSLAL
jgi:hypothetical protein